MSTRLPLSSAQLEVWAAFRADPGSCAFTMACCLDVRGDASFRKLGGHSVLAGPAGAAPRRLGVQLGRGVNALPIRYERRLPR